MAFTRFSNDIALQQKRLEESTFSGIYHLNTPGNGIHNPYINDIHIRLQKWGANLHTNSTNIESQLRTMNIPLGRDTLSYKKVEPSHSKLSYKDKSFLVDETRSSMPAWKIREKTQSRYDYLPLNPQENLFIPFQNNLNTRMLEKDYYTKNKK
jgi:hypothetical protein